jgi:hypothetical protein
VNESHGLAGMGLTLNAPYLAEWADRIGRFILNFGSIELLSYQHLLLLEKTHEEFLLNVGRKFAKRVERTNSLIPDNPKLSAAEKDLAIERWKEAAELANWRNRIAHNPVLPTWKDGDSDKDPPDLLGIPDVRQMKDGMTSDSIPLALMNQLVDHAAALGQQLHEVSGWLNR